MGIFVWHTPQTAPYQTAPTPKLPQAAPAHAPKRPQTANAPFFTPPTLALPPFLHRTRIRTAPALAPKIEPKKNLSPELKRIRQSFMQFSKDILNH